MTLRRSPLKANKYCPRCGKTLCGCGSTLQRKQPPRKRTALPKRNEKRRKKREQEGRVYGPKMDWMKRQDCLLWDREGHVCRPGTVVGHHDPTVKAGGTDADMVPLCVIAHREVHDIGRETFQRKWNVDVRLAAKHYEEEWQALNQGEKGRA